MSATPPVRRRVHPAVTIRRAQSERRYLNPWQVSWPQPPLHPPLLHHDPVRGSTWTWVDHHHHAPRTAFIPPVSAQQPCMMGHPQAVFAEAGSVRYQPSLSCAQLPPIALGAPPMLPPMTLEERLAQDRLTAFLAGETLPHRPRSILSCPESPLYESLLSCFNEPEDTVTLPETEVEHDYQQIEVVDGAPRGQKSGSGDVTAKENKSPERGSTGQNSPDGHPESHRHPQKTLLTKLNTLDVRPERHGKENEAAQESKYCCSSRKDVLDTSPSAKTRKHSTQSISSQESQKSANYTLSSLSGDTTSVISDSDTYQELSQPSTVIYVSSGKRNVVTSEGSHGSESSGIKSSSKHNGNIRRSNSQHHGNTHGSHASSSGSSNVTYKTSHISRSNSADVMSHDEMMGRGKPPAAFPPLTIELPETKTTSWKYEQQVSVKKAAQTRHNDTPYIITTLDPPIKRSSHKHHNTTSSPEPRPTDIPPLVVNFDSEDSVSEDDTVYEFRDAYWSSADGNTSMYMADSDTSSVYSSIGEIYSMFVTEPDALVYVYRPPPRPRDHGHHRTSTLSYRFPAYAITRDIGSSGCSSESESSWGGTVSFVEPSYRHSNLSVGSRGHLKFDYSCSWNRLDDFVRTAKPKDEYSRDYRQHYRCPRDCTPEYMTSSAALPSPWERFTDTAAG
ncbi:uncharacterized protein LOC123504200 [Portunus trituberculatus]|uniref:uncharacterized protein LOC123504200 n=1 Tax=Portunus trituberculatus TaxID=210409 RepID=UPI001E1CF128|nr:uncharacterized protein LOC123504200 [Portunus trituberculatus]